LIFVIQRDDCDRFSIAKDIDPKYADLLSDAIKKKLNILCYDCKFSPKGIKLNKQINIKI
jgi:sugar fermentation stimulation protein A